jgi:hypothetical protein
MPGNNSHHLRQFLREEPIERPQGGHNRRGRRLEAKRAKQAGTPKRADKTPKLRAHGRPGQAPKPRHQLGQIVSARNPWYLQFALPIVLVVVAILFYLYFGAILHQWRQWGTPH